MSLRKELEAKNASIFNKGHEDTAAGAVPAPRRPANTGPGALLGLNNEMRAAEQREQELKDKLREFEGAAPVCDLDTNLIQLSPWANRHVESFTTAAYLSLKQDIQQAGGNVQPIKVRPKPGGQGGYELIYGQRRHRACQELGLPVKAIIEALSDQELFAAMDRENRNREDLSPFELGLHYQRALTAKLWPTQGALASALGVSQGYVSKVVALASLPKEVLAAFPSVLELQAPWGLALQSALNQDRERVLRDAKSLAKHAAQHSAKQVFDRLIGKVQAAPGKLFLRNNLVAQFEHKGGRLTVRFEPNAVSPEKLEQLPGLIEGWLGE